MPTWTPAESDALIIVDFQMDFCPGGALAVKDGDAILAPVSRLLDVSVWHRVATRDWHPADHISFHAQGGVWPSHCVAGTPGAELHPGVAPERRVDQIVDKGTDRDAEAYSGFDGTSLADDLRARGVGRVIICGLATDFCVRATALDARREGFEVIVLKDAVRAVNLAPGDGDAALTEMEEAGCILASSGDIRTD